MERTHSPNSTEPGRDPVAELIHNAGRRPEPPAEIHDAVKRAGFDAWQSQLRTRRNRRRWLAAAASLVLALTSLALLEFVGLRDLEAIGTIARIDGPVAHDNESSDGLAMAGATLVSGDVVRTGADAGAALELGGGISLRMNSQTVLELTAADAIGLVSGAIYVDSDDRALDRAFAISTPFGVVTDIGTRFEVRGGDDSLRVRVRSGLVRLSQSTVVADIDGGAGDEFEVTATGAISQRQISPTDPAWQWAEGLAVVPTSGFASIRDCFEWIARETGREIRFDSASTEIQAELRDFGGDPEGLMPMELLDFISRISDFGYEMQADNSILISRK